MDGGYRYTFHERTNVVEFTVRWDLVVHRCGVEYVLLGLGWFDLVVVHGSVS